MNVRLIVCIDIEADDLIKAYAVIYNLMSSSGLQWETSDEWYKQEESGDPAELQKAINKFYMG